MKKNSSHKTYQHYEYWNLYHCLYLKYCGNFKAECGVPY